MNQNTLTHKSEQELNCESGRWQAWRELPRQLEFAFFAESPFALVFSAEAQTQIGGLDDG